MGGEALTCGCWAMSMATVEVPLFCAPMSKKVGRQRGSPCSSNSSHELLPTPCAVWRGVRRLASLLPGAFSYSLNRRSCLPPRAAPASELRGTTSGDGGGVL